MNRREVLPRTIPDDWFTPWELAAYSRFESGMTYAAIADALGSTVPNIASTIACAKKRIRERGPKATGHDGKALLDKLAARDRRLGLDGTPCRCGLRGEHECLSGNGWARRPVLWG